jgi:hypothetical protein
MYPSNESLLRGRVYSSDRYIHSDIDSVSDSDSNSDSDSDSEYEEDEDYYTPVNYVEKYNMMDKQVQPEILEAFLVNRQIQKEIQEYTKKPDMRLERDEEFTSLIVSHNTRIQCLLNIFNPTRKKTRFMNCAILKLEITSECCRLSLVYSGELEEKEKQKISVARPYYVNYPTENPGLIEYKVPILEDIYEVLSIFKLPTYLFDELNDIKYTFFIIRHGQSQHNITRKIVGFKVSNTFGLALDTNITAAGNQQAITAGEELKKYLDNTFPTTILFKKLSKMHQFRQDKIKEDMLKLIKIYEPAIFYLSSNPTQEPTYHQDLNTETLVDLSRYELPINIDYSLKYVISHFHYISLFIHRIREKVYGNKYPSLFQQYLLQSKLITPRKNPFDTCFVSDLRRTNQTLQSIFKGMDVEKMKPVILPCASELAKEGTYGNCDAATSKAPFYTKLARENKTSILLTNGKAHKNEDRNFDLYIPFYNGSARGTLGKKVLHCRNTTMISLAIYYLNREYEITHRSSMANKEELTRYIHDILVNDELEKRDDDPTKQYRKTNRKKFGGKTRKRRQKTRKNK